MDCRCDHNSTAAYPIVSGTAETVELKITSPSGVDDVESVTAYFTAGRHPSIAVNCTLDRASDGCHAYALLTAEQTEALGEYARNGDRIHMCAHVAWTDGTEDPISFGGTRDNPVYELPIRVVTCHHN